MADNQDALAGSVCKNCVHQIALKAGGKVIYRCSVVEDVSKLMHVMQHCPRHRTSGC